MVMESGTAALVRQHDNDRLDPIRAVKHEIRNALTPLIAYAVELGKSETDSMRKQQLMAIQRSALSIERLISSIDSSERLFEPRFQVVRVGELLAAAADEAGPEAKRQRVRLKVQPDETHRTRVFADPELIRRLLVNLILNAVRVTSTDEEVCVSARPVPGGVRFAVRDHGPGLPVASLEDLPNGFSTRSGAEHGTGLAICRTIAMYHGGLLRSNNLEDGAEVFFILPHFSPRPHNQLGEDRPRLLVVDDDTLVADAIARLLSDRYRVYVAHRIEGALERLQAERYDALLLDVHLGSGSGPGLLAELDARGIERPPRVVFVTGDPNARIEHLPAGPSLLAKPFGRDELERMLSGQDSPGPERPRVWPDAPAMSAGAVCAVCA